MFQEPEQRRRQYAPVGGRGNCHLSTGQGATGTASLAGRPVSQGAAVVRRQCLPGAVGLQLKEVPGLAVEPEDCACQWESL